MTRHDWFVIIATLAAIGLWAIGERSSAIGLALGLLFGRITR